MTMINNVLTHQNVSDYVISENNVDTTPVSVNPDYLKHVRLVRSGFISNRAELVVSRNDIVSSAQEWESESIEWQRDLETIDNSWPEY